MPQNHQFERNLTKSLEIKLNQILQIRKLGRDGQLGIKENIMNVPINVDQMVCSLPRNMDDDCSINIHLKKKLAFKSPYLSYHVNYGKLKT